MCEIQLNIGCRCRNERQTVATHRHFAAFYSGQQHFQTFFKRVYLQQSTTHPCKETVRYLDSALYLVVLKNAYKRTYLLSYI